jgi:hypothetical protein
MRAHVRMKDHQLRAPTSCAHPDKISLPVLIDQVEDIPQPTQRNSQPEPADKKLSMLKSSLLVFLVRTLNDC